MRTNLRTNAIKLIKLIIYSKHMRFGKCELFNGSQTSRTWAGASGES